MAWYEYSVKITRNNGKTIHDWHQIKDMLPRKCSESWSIPHPSHGAQIAVKHFTDLFSRWPKSMLIGTITVMRKRSGRQWQKLGEWEDGNLVWASPKQVRYAETRDHVWISNGKFTELTGINAVCLYCGKPKDTAPAKCGGERMGR